jgi:hypothetical protein
VHVLFVYITILRKLASGCRFPRLHGHTSIYITFDSYSKPDLAYSTLMSTDALQVYCASSVCGSISSKSFVNIQPGTLLRFRCRRGSEDVQGKITWIKGGSHLSESDCPSNRIALPCTRRDTGQTLMLRNITKTTSIRCQVGNTTSAQFTVTVIDSNRLTN